MKRRCGGHLQGGATRREGFARHGVCKISHVATLSFAWQRYPVAVPRPRLRGEAANQAPMYAPQRGCEGIMRPRPRSAHESDSRTMRPEGGSETAPCPSVPPSSIAQRRSLCSKRNETLAHTGIRCSVKATASLGGPLPLPYAQRSKWDVPHAASPAGFSACVCVAVGPG